MGDAVAMGTRGRRRAPTVTDVPAAGDRGDVRARGERGAVAAEAAVVIPLLLAVTLGLVWLVALAVTQVRVVDAARETVRAAARGDSDAVAIDRGRRVAPDGARFRVRRSAEQVVVEVVTEVRGPGGLLGFLPALPVRSEAVAAEEPR